ncbi:hypothetical protein ACFL3H_04325 [Gemmatimonadota bacterium]
MVELDDILSYPAERAARGEPEFEETYVRLLQRFSGKYYRYRLLFLLLEKVTSSLRRTGTVDIVFLGTPFLDLMLKTRSIYSIASLVQDEHELRAARRHTIPLHMAWKWKADLYRAYVAPDEATRRALIERTVADIGAVLQRASPRAVVVKNDSLFLERAVIAAARVAGIPTMTIQHGLFQRAAGSHVYDGFWTDHMLVWGEYFRDLYLENGILPEECVHVLGYPYPVLASPVRAGDVSLSICLLGQSWELNEHSLRKMKHELISIFMDACQRHGIDLVYRPHPAEHRDELHTAFPALRLTAEAETLAVAIDRFDLFISWTSTALIEAALHGRSAVQVRSGAIPMDDYSAVGACYSIEGDEEGITRFLEGVKRSEYPPMAVSDHYMRFSEDPGEEFFSIMRKISESR